MVKYTEREAGTYRCRFVKLDTEYKITDRQTGQEVTRWRWVFQEVADSTTVGEIDTLSSPGFGKGTNGMRFFMGMLGRPPTQTDDTDDLIGQEFDVVYSPNKAGTLAITGVLRVVPLPTVAAVAPGLPPVDQTAPGELPF